MKNTTIEYELTRKGRIAAEIIDLLKTPNQQFSGDSIVYLFARFCQLTKLYDQECRDFLNTYNPDVPLYHQACCKFNYRNFLNLTERACDYVNELESNKKNLKTLDNLIIHMANAPLQKRATRFNKIAILTLFSALLIRYNEICDVLNCPTVDSKTLYSQFEDSIFPQNDENNAKFFNRRRRSPQLTRIYMKPLESYKNSWHCFDLATQRRIQKAVFDHFNSCPYLRPYIRADRTYSAWIVTYLIEKKDRILIDTYALESDYPESYINQFLRNECLDNLIELTTSILQKYKISELKQAYSHDGTPDQLAKRAILGDENLLLKLLSSCQPWFLEELCQDTLFLQNVRDTSSLAYACFTEIAATQYYYVSCVKRLLKDISADIYQHQVKDSPRPLTPGSASEN